MRHGLRHRLWRWAAACVVVAAGLAVLIATFVRAGLMGAGAAAAVLVVVPLGVSLLVWARRSYGTDVRVTVDQARKARRDLAEMVREQWLAEFGARRLYDPNPIVVKWRLAGRPVADASADVTTGTRGLVGRADQVSELASWFRDLGRHRLVIIGDPGMGAARIISALLTLREDVIAPLLAGVADPRIRRTPRHWTDIDRHYQALRLEMMALFADIGIACG